MFNLQYEYAIRANAVRTLNRIVDARSISDIICLFQNLLIILGNVWKEIYCKKLVVDYMMTNTLSCRNCSDRFLKVSNGNSHIKSEESGKIMIGDILKSHAIKINMEAPPPPLLRFSRWMSFLGVSVCPNAWAEMDNYHTALAYYFLVQADVTNLDNHVSLWFHVGSKIFT